MLKIDLAHEVSVDYLGPHSRASRAGKHEVFPLAVGDQSEG